MRDDVMYFPYFRGRQFELLALQDLLKANKIGSQIIPVIEPVKLSSTLDRTISLFSEYHHSLGIIMNPMVGDLVQLCNEVFLMDYHDFKCRDLLQSSSSVIKKAFIMYDQLPARLRNNSDNNDVIIINKKRDDLKIFNELYLDDQEPTFTFIPDDRRFQRRVKKSAISLSDHFNKLRRNSDYLNQEDEFYSDDHLYYKEDGFIGFSDYSIVGSDYNETGFAPVAVAIHIVYFDSDQSLRIRHFVSDSNVGYHDPARKYGEALKKLVRWADDKKKTDDQFLETDGLYLFRSNLKEGRYPGLGTIKKYSIMHHIELVNSFLEDN